MLFLCLVYGVSLASALTIYETAAATPSLSTLTAVLQLPAYEAIGKALDSPGTFTVFAPNDDAFRIAGLDVGQIEKVTAILQYHVLGSVVMSTDLQALQFPETILTGSDKYVNVGEGRGQSLFIEASGGRVTIYFANKQAQVVLADVVCDNGVVHVINAVIEIPPPLWKQLSYNTGFDTLRVAVLRAGLLDGLDTTAGITLFAPYNYAFDNAGIDVNTTAIDVLTNVLSYHLVPQILYTTDIEDGMTVTTLQGGTLRLSHPDGSNKFGVNDANVAIPNVLVRNGVILFIDAVLLPPSPTPFTPPPPPTPTSQNQHQRHQHQPTETH